NRDKSSVKTAVRLPEIAWAFLHNLQLFFLVEHKRISRHALDQENVSADRGTCPNHSFAAEHGRIGINGNIILDCRMTLTAFLDFATLVLLRSEEHTSELQSRGHLVCRLLLEKKKLT